MLVPASIQKYFGFRDRFDQLCDLGVWGRLCSFGYFFILIAPPSTGKVLRNSETSGKFMVMKSSPQSFIKVSLRPSRHEKKIAYFFQHF